MSQSERLALRGEPVSSPLKLLLTTLSYLCPVRRSGPSRHVLFLGIFVSCCCWERSLLFFVACVSFQPPKSSVSKSWKSQVQKKSLKNGSFEKVEKYAILTTCTKHRAKTRRIHAAPQTSSILLTINCYWPEFERFLFFEVADFAKNLIYTYT